MGLHKLTAGDGYTYLTRQVAAHDSSERGATSLADYYSELGESPGTWWGAGLSGIDISAGDEVCEEQMRNLFGEGRHPDAEAMEDAVVAAGGTATAAAKASQLGRRFAIYEGSPEFQQRVAQRLSEHNASLGLHLSLIHI